MDIGWKVVSAGAGILSGIVANKLVDVVWRAILRRDHPNAEDVTEPLRDAIVFSIVSASVGAVVNQLVMRRTAQWYGVERVMAEVKKDHSEPSHLKQASEYVA